jgi:hypothetical protein
MEIEIPRRLIRSLFSILLVIAPLLIGIFTSPYSDNHRPFLLTPRLARINDYRRSVHVWVKSFQSADTNLSTLLEKPPSDLFDQDNQVNRIYQQEKLTAEAIDQAGIPPTFESLHELLGNTASAYLEVATLAVRWTSEPTSDNRQAVVTALSTAHELLQRLSATPWIEAKP